MRSLLTVIAVGMVISAGTAWAGTLKVPSQYETISEAVAAAQDGDTILISKGRYQESVSTKKRLDFKGKKGAIWDGYFDGMLNSQLWVSGDGVTVSGITFEHGFTPVSIVGDDASVTKCRFRRCENGVYVDGANASVQKNMFSGQLDYQFSIDVDGPDAVISGNRMVHGYAGVIEVDAEGEGGATVSGNLIDTMGGDDCYIEVENAAGASVTKNVFKNFYLSGYAIDLENCDDAVVSGNRQVTINYNVDGGVYVNGHRALVTKNHFENLNNYDDDIYVVHVEGNDAVISSNKIRICGSGEDYDTYGIYVDGDDADVSRNTISDMGGGGDETYGVSVNGVDGTIDSNKISYLNDEYTYAIYYNGDRCKVTRNKIAHVMYEADIYIEGDSFLVEGNSVKDGAYDCSGIYTSGSSTTKGAAAIRGNSVSYVAGYAIYHSGDGVEISGNKVNHVAGDGIYVSGNSNVLSSNSVTGCWQDAFYVSGDSNTLSRCSAKDADQDGYDIEGDGNSLDGCKATNCAAEGLDNSGTGTIATNCTFKGSRIDYAGNRAMANDSGTKYDTGSAGTVPQID